MLSGSSVTTRSNDYTVTVMHSNQYNKVNHLSIDSLLDMCNPFTDLYVVVSEDGQHDE